MNEFLDRIYADKYDEALAFLKDNSSQFKEYTEFDNQQAYNRIVRAKQFALLDFLIDSNAVESDVYEYDSFRRSIFESVLKNIPDDEESRKYLKSFIAKFDNINDEVSGDTLLRFALSEKVSPQIIQILIDAGCDASYKNNAESNLLIESVRLNMIPPEQQPAYMKLFTGAGIDVNERNVERKNVLHHATKKILYLFFRNKVRRPMNRIEGQYCFSCSISPPQKMPRVLPVSIKEYSISKCRGVTVSMPTNGDILSGKNFTSSLPAARRLFNAFQVPLSNICFTNPDFDRLNLANIRL